MKPKYSIIIPVAPDRKAPILKYIKKQKFDRKKYEVIVIKGTNVPENRNNGFAKSKGEWIIYLDSDAYIEPDFMSKVDAFIKKHPKIDIIGGPQLTPDDDGPFAEDSGIALASPIVNPGAFKRYRITPENLNADEGYISGALMIIRRKVLKEIRFDIDQYPADDVTFIKKARKKGFKVASSPDIYLFHKRRPTTKGLAKQYFDYGEAGAKMEEGRGIMFAAPALLVLYFLTLPLMMALLTEFNIPFNALWLLPLAAYGILIIVYGSPMVIIHFAYGIGVIKVWGEKLIELIIGFFLLATSFLFAPFLAWTLKGMDWNYESPKPKTTAKDIFYTIIFYCVWLLLLPLSLILWLVGLIIFAPVALISWMIEKKQEV